MTTKSKAITTKVPPITRAARRDLLKAHANGGVYGGLCNGPAQSLVDHGLAVIDPTLTKGWAAGGSVVVLTSAGKALAAHLVAKVGSAETVERLVEEQDKATAAKRARRTTTNGSTLEAVPPSAPEPEQAPTEATPVTKPVTPNVPPAELPKRLTEAEVVEWITTTRATDPAASWVKMTKAIRATGRSCSNARFRRILTAMEASGEAAKAV